ncbi:MAG: hypothetical protein ABI416_00205 [Ginsengibacter sp.]
MESLITGCVLILVCMVISILFYNQLEPKWLKVFTWFLLFTILSQVAGFVYSFYSKKSNHFIFNIYILVQFIFYFGIFYKTFQSKKFKLTTLFITLAFLVYYWYIIIFETGFYVFNSAGNSVGSVLTIFCCLLYFVSLFSSEIVVNYFRISMFWIATGLLFFFVGNFIYLTFIGYIVNHNLDSGGNFYRYIMVTLNLLMYGLFSIGFISNQLWKKTM